MDSVKTNMFVGKCLRFLTWCILSVAVCSCEVEFDLKGLDGDPLFLIDGVIRREPSDPEYGHLQMYVSAVPSVAGVREFSEDARCTLKVYLNSRLVDTKDYITIKEFYGLVADNYSGVKPGDEITVTAESEGFSTAVSKVVMPSLPPSLQVSYTPAGKYLKVRLSFEDDPDTDDAYAFIFRKTVKENGGIPDDSDIGSAVEPVFGNSSESSFIDIGPFDVSWVDGERYYGISDNSFSGGRKEIEVTVPMSEDAGRIFFRVQIQRISPERLRYETACRDKATNVLGFIGLAPVSFAYTNVSGGSGCFSAGNAGYSPWQEIVSAF